MRKIVNIMARQLEKAQDWHSASKRAALAVEVGLAELEPILIDRQSKDKQGQQLKWKAWARDSLLGAASIAHRMAKPCHVWEPTVFLTDSAGRSATPQALLHQQLNTWAGIWRASKQEP